MQGGWSTDNGWKFEGNAQMIELTTMSKIELTIPTPLVVEAFEQYLMYLEARGFKSMKDGGAA